MLRRTLIALCLTSLACGKAAAIPEQSDFILQWSPRIVDAIQNSSIPPCLASRNLAIIHVAGFDAANAIDPKYVSYTGIETPDKSLDPAIASISAIAFSAETLFPNHRAVFRSLREEQYRQLENDIATTIRIQSAHFGESVAKRMIEMRANDGSTSALTYVPKNEVGKWKRTPPKYRPPELSYWSNTRPFAIEHPSQFRIQPPPGLNTLEYARALEEVRTIGSANSKTRTKEQTEIAEFWSCFSYTSTPAGHWYEIATRTARKEALPLIESARLLALISIAMADAGIACWDTKYFYESWRPIQAIHAADQDGNPDTKSDSSWDSLLESPPHPEYVSGHGSFSGAGGKIMEFYFNAENGYSFYATSTSLPGVVRRFSSFSECVEEICLSRLYGGIHFRYSNDRGRQLGEQVAEFILDTQLRPLNKDD